VSEWTKHLGDLLLDLPANLGGHMLLSLTALAVGLAVSLPLGIAVSRRPRLSEWVLSVAGILQTIPSLALLALMVPLLGGMIGFWPAFVAMTLYSLLPIVANTILGIRGVDASYIEAARGLGMSDMQMLTRVQLPLAAPVILGGIRTATVLVIGSATLATPVGQRTLGNYIFEGLNIRDNLMVLLGCVLAALLAVVFDQLIRLLEVASRLRDVRLGRGAAVALVLVTAAGLSQPVHAFLRPPANPVVVGTHDNTEQHILAEVLRDTLTRAGFHVDQRKCMAPQVTFESLRAGGIDCCIDYTGNLWQPVMKRKDRLPPDETLREVTAFLRERHDIECLGALGFENAYALAVRREDAAKLGDPPSVADLARLAPRLRIAGDMQFFQLEDWKRMKSAYGLKFAEEKAMDQTLMYDALRNGEVDVISAYSTDGRVKAFDFVILKDPKMALPGYHAILLVSGKALEKPGLREALTPLVAAIDQDRMLSANKLVDVDRVWPREAGRTLLRLLRRGDEGQR
jgi:osmoprotectant transport system permease protein